MSWEHQYTEKESGIDFVISHSYVWGRGAIRSAGFELTDTFIEAVKSRDPKIFTILDMATRHHETVFFLKDLEGGHFNEALKRMSISELRTGLESVLACDSPLLTDRERGIARAGLSYLDNKEWLQEQAENQKDCNTKRRKEFNKKKGSLWGFLVERDGEFCAECGDTEDLSIDHKAPISKGGSDDLENLQILCRKHNSQKGTRIPAEAGPTR